MRTITDISIIEAMARGTDYSVIRFLLPFALALGETVRYLSPSRR